MFRPFDSRALSPPMSGVTPAEHLIMSQLTAPFEVTFHSLRYELVPRCSEDELHTWDSKSVCILLEGECQISPDTVSLSLDFKHSTMLDTSTFTRQVGCFQMTLVREIPVSPFQRKFF